MKRKSFEREKINIDYSDPGLPLHVRHFLPDLYKDGDNYECVLGAGDTAIVAGGISKEDALNNWEKAFTTKFSFDLEK